MNKATAAWVVTGFVGLVAVALEVVYRVKTGDATSFRGDILWTLLPVSFAAVGSLIVSRQDDNRIGWILLAIGVGMTLSNLSDPLFFGADDPPATLSPWLFVALWFNNIAWATFFLPMFMLLYLFPTGELLSRRWIWAPRLAVGLFCFLAFGGLLSDEIGPTTEAWVIENPIGRFGTDTMGVIFIPFFVGLLGFVVGGVVAVVARYRRAPAMEKEQIKWVLFGFFVFATLFLIAFLLESWGSDIQGLLLVIGISAIPVSITIAVLKFKLYDIDVVISKSLTFGVLLVFIGVVYVGIVVGIGELLGGEDGSSFGLSVAATAVVAIAFQPVRIRVERWANRLVYGKRATPYEVLARFSHRASEDEDVLRRIPQMIVDGTGASDARLWIRSSEGFHTASVWPESDVVQTLGDSDGFEDPDADLSLPVVHDGELLGGISLVAVRGGTITSPEQELVTNLAEGLGLTLRNSRLTAALRRQIEDLQRSRDRVVSAADDARRSLEHDLDSGPQQQLVAVKVKLGPLRKLAEQAGAVTTATMLADIDQQAGDAIQAVRDFATGIYPPLLGAEGLVVALGHETNKAALPVEVEADGVGRYPRDIESAVYFSILEVLQNSAKYADASQAVVRLRQLNGDLSFEVSDNGRGFDPATVGRGEGLNGIADRIDTIGGTLKVDSTPGDGTVVTGSIPVSDR